MNEYSTNRKDRWGTLLPSLLLRSRSARSPPYDDCCNCCNTHVFAAVAVLRLTSTPSDNNRKTHMYLRTLSMCRCLVTLPGVLQPQPRQFAVPRKRFRKLPPKDSLGSPSTKVSVRVTSSTRPNRCPHLDCWCLSRTVQSRAAPSIFLVRCPECIGP